MVGAVSPDTKWQDVRYAYEHSDETIKQICERFGVTKGSLEHHYRQQRWVSRRSNIEQRRLSTLERLFAILDLQVAKLGAVSSTTLGDKEASQLSEMIKNFDKLSTMRGQQTQKGGAVEDKATAELRIKLAERIDQFNRR
jgi:hypothetical protein